MSGPGVQSACPQCGAPLRFGGARSIVTVCAHCRCAIARADAEVSSLGKMPDLVATDTRLALGCSGKLAQRSFSVLGRVQLDAGQATWDEWYVVWADGSYGWLAEARGRLIVTRRHERPVEIPLLSQWRAGERAQVLGLGEVSVEEVGEAKLVSAQGELPFQPRFDAAYRYVDASMPGGGYATFDYGCEGTDVEVFVGRELSYADAGMGDLGPQHGEPQARGSALACPNCGAPLSPKLEQTKSLVCGSCRGLCSVSEGRLALIAALAQRRQPALPLGARGELFGQKLEVIGWVGRRCTAEGQDYDWSEYLLHGESGYRWLSEVDGHWTYLEPIPAARAMRVSAAVRIDGRTLKHFQTSEAVRYTEMQGEFYWELRPDDRVRIDDYVAPPFMASREAIGREVNWSYGQHVAGDELFRSFGQSKAPPAGFEVGPCQPNPYAERKARSGVIAGYALTCVAILAAIIGFTLPRKRVLSVDIPTSGVTLTDPFEIRGGTHALEVRARSLTPLHNAWIGLDIALIDDATGEADALGIELEHWTGYEGGERWSEGSSSRSDVIGSIPPGRYVLRVEPYTYPMTAMPGSVRLQVIHGVFLWFPLLLAVALIGTIPLVFAVRSHSFETRRWHNSDYGREH